MNLTNEADVDRFWTHANQIGLTQGIIFYTICSGKVRSARVQVESVRKSCKKKPVDRCRDRAYTTKLRAETALLRPGLFGLSWHYEKCCAPTINKE